MISLSISLSVESLNKHEIESNRNGFLIPKDFLSLLLNDETNGVNLREISRYKRNKSIN